ncbi:MAG TPA: polysaccharide pyruvyl transferase family protein, partial [Firmicutes bacterium]|nr:polysaccharide pyruvyl transferase family protein [Bacillota bacterium]
KSSDLAFLKLPGQDDYNAELILDKYNLQKDNYITMIPSGLVRCYTDNRKKYIENLIRIIEYIITVRRIKIVLMPHVLRPETSDDRIIIREIIKQIGKVYLEKLIIIDDIMLPLDARVILGNGIFSITGRMHGAISTFQMNKPAISLSYSVKYQGVIGEGLACHDLIVEASDYKKWENGEVALETINKIEYLFNDYTTFVTRIRSKAAFCKDEVFQMIDQVHSELEGL